MNLARPLAAARPVTAITAAAALVLGAVVAAPTAASAAAGDATTTATTATIAGRIAFPDDAVPVVALFDATDEVAEGEIADDGSYTITVDQPGDYTVAFGDGGDTYLTRFWNGTAAGVVLDDAPDGATFFTVGAGATITGIDGTLGLVDLGATAPAITGGTPRVGRTLSLALGDWADVADLDIQWLRDGRAIDGEGDDESDPTGEDYEVSIADVGHRLSATIDATADGYLDATVITASVAVPGKTLHGGRPSIAGAAKVGGKLTATPRKWTSGTTVRYQWFANGKPITKATRATLKVTKKLAGKRITVVTTGYKKGYALLATTSKRTAKVR